MNRGTGCRRAVVVVLMLVSCAVPVVFAESEAGPAPAPPTAAQQVADARPLYRIGVGDQLDVFVIEENSHTECLVRPDGRITLALAGDIEAEGLTPPELAQKIKKALEPYQKDPTVTVAVREINSYRIYVLNNVTTQMMIQSTAPLRVLQALAMAGGFNAYAKKTLVVVRDRKGAPPLRIPVNVPKIVSGDAPEMNVRLEAGDVLWAE